MERELRISVIVILTFSIYGLVSLISSGSFVTPFFLSHLIVLGISILFFALNAEIKSAWILGLFSLSFLGYSLHDKFVIWFLTQKLNLSGIDQLTQSTTFALISFVFFFTILFLTIHQLYKESSLPIAAILLALILTVIIALFFTELYFVQNILMILFLILYFVVAQRKVNSEKSVSRILSAQFLLLALLDSLYFFF